MSPLPEDFDWRQSRAHVKLLSHFVKPRDEAQVLGWQFVREGLKEKTKSALERFRREGCLMPATVEESLDCRFTAAEVKASLKKAGQKVTGAKADLIERLIATSMSDVRKLLGKAVVLKCSVEMVRFVHDWQAAADAAREQANQATYSALLAGDAGEAWRLFAAYQRAYGELYSDDGRWKVIRIERLLAARPEALDGIDPGELRMLQAAAGMAQLWPALNAEPWLPTSLRTHAALPAQASNWIGAAARINADLQDPYRTDRCMRLKIADGDAESCGRCRAMVGREFAAEATPRFPLAGCSSPIGCAIEWKDCRDGDEEDEVKRTQIDEASDEENESDPDPLTALRALKAMLDENLITQVEFDAKKKEILGRL